MDAADAIKFVSENHRAVLVTRGRNDRLQSSPITVGADEEGKVVISSREAAYKVRNLKRDARATICALNDGFFGKWMQIDGRAEIVPLPEAMDGLVDYYRRISGEHPDWEDYRQAMIDQERVLIRVTIERVGPTRSG
jgi:PPOX class probable F420-dependent enzyme